MMNEAVKVDCPRRSRRRLPCGAGPGALLLLLAPIGVAAQPPPVTASPGTQAAPAPLELAENSPRASLSDYLDLSRQRRFDEAARHLAVPAGANGAELARRLKAVLDRHLWIDLEMVSASPGGDEEDDLPPGTDAIGTIPTPAGPQPVRMVRQEDAEGRWVFSPGTVGRIDGWYLALGDSWVREYLPGALLRPGPRELLWWQWIALALLLFLAWPAGRLLSWLTRALLARVFARTATEWDDVLLRRLGGPITLAWSLAIAYLLLPLLQLYAPAQTFMHEVLSALVVLTLFWALWRMVDVVGHALLISAWGRQNPSAKSLLSIGVRVGHVAVLVLGAIAGLSQLGYPVASLLAGLGIGGLAVALAAQKSMENFFGSLSLAGDQPFRVGDFVKVEDFVGTVETIGLRSTRIRTLDRTLISIPNGRLADMRLESFTARDRMRLACTVGVEYGTTAAQMRQVLEGLERVLRSHPRIWPDAVVVRFKEFGPSSLDIEVMAWFQTSVWAEFQLIRQEVLIQFMEVVEGAGTSFAFPTRTVHLVGQAEPRPEKEERLAARGGAGGTVGR